MNPTTYKQPRGPKRPAFAQAGDLLAKSSAIALTFFGTGPAFSKTEPSVSEFVSNAYSPELIWVAALLWFALLAAIIFAFSTLIIAALIQLTSLKSAVSLFKNRY